MTSNKKESTDLCTNFKKNLKLVNITVFQSSVLLFVKFDITGTPNDRLL